MNNLKNSELEGDYMRSIECKKEETTLYRIGLFSQMNKVTVKTLRHYDEIGLLKPEHIDKFTGYRYYTSAQLPTLHDILALRQMGMTLDEIKKVQAGANVKSVLEQKKVELLKNIAEETRKLSEVEYYLSNKIEEYKYNVVIKELPEVIVASMRTVIPNYDGLFNIYPEMGIEMERLGCECAVPEYCFSVYHNGEYKEENIDVEICEAVTEIKENSKIVSFKSFKKVEAACVLYKGPYNNFPKVYAALVCWIEKNNYEIIDNPRESYIDGIWNKDNEEEWLTEIQFPIKKRI